MKPSEKLRAESAGSELRLLLDAAADLLDECEEPLRLLVLLKVVPADTREKYERLLARLLGEQP